MGTISFQDDNKDDVDVYKLITHTIEQTEAETIKNNSLISYWIKYVTIWIKKNYKIILIFLGIIFNCYQLLCFLASYIWTVYYINTNMFIGIGNILMNGFILPGAIFLYSSCFDEGNFHNRKIFIFILMLLNFISSFTTLISMFLLNLIIPLVLSIPITNDISIGMILTLGRVVSALFILLTFIMLSTLLFRNALSEKSKLRIFHFKFNRNWDTRKNKNYLYDMKIIRRMDNGKRYIIQLADRMFHSLFIGTTGTGKTSTCLTTSINDDLDQRVKNIDTLKRKVSKLLKKGKIYMIKDFDDEYFSIDYVDSDNLKYKKLLKKYREKYPVAGITTMAPNEKFADEIYELSQKKGFSDVNRIDPILTPDGKHKPGFIGYNPLFISPLLKGIDRKLEVFLKAKSFADVLQAIFEKEGASDIYFAGLNRNLTTSIAIMVLLTYPSLNNGKQPTPNSIQEIINDFKKAKPYRDEMVRIYSTKFNLKGSNKDPILEGKADIGEYQFILDVIDSALLGNSAEKMFDQATGLRNIINETLANPLIREVLCNENSVDMDKMLDRGEITLVNYAITLGSAGTAFGLFYMLNMINAVLRRPAGKKLLPHFWNIDELPELLHADLGRTVALFRQYNVSMAFALQSIDQLEKTSKTKYLKNVIIGGCAHQIVYGRCSAAEMKMYQEFAGTKKTTVEMVGVTETALTMENTSMSMNRRETEQTVNRFEGGDIRYRDFREVTVFSVKNGSPIEPFYGITFFLEDVKKIQKVRYKFDWHSYFHPIQSVVSEEEVGTLEKNALTISKTNVREKEQKIEKHSPELIEEDIIDTVSSTQIAMKEKKVQNYTEDEILISSGSPEQEEQQEEQPEEKSDRNEIEEFGFTIEEEE